MLYFARLHGDIPGIDKYIRFFADDIIDAESFVFDRAEENYLNHSSIAYNMDVGTPRFEFDIEPWDDAKHGGFVIGGNERFEYYAPETTAQNG